MELDEQLLSFFFSFLYGFVVIIAYKLSYKYIYKFLNSLLLMVDLSLIYFKIFYIINGGIINIYFILITIITFIYFKDKLIKIRNK